MHFHCELNHFEVRIDIAVNSFNHLKRKTYYFVANCSTMLEFGELVEPNTRAFWSNYDEFEEE